MSRFPGDEGVRACDAKPVTAQLRSAPLPGSRPSPRTAVNTRRVLSERRRRFPQVLPDEEGGLRRETPVPPSAEIQANIDKLLGSRLVDDPQKMLSELARLGARLMIQRAVEEEFDTWLGRARYERRPERQCGLRNGFRPRHLQTAEGELRIEIPQVREAAMPFVSKLFPKWHCKRLLRTDPLKALIVGGFVRGLSTRDVESLCEEAGLGKTSNSTVSRVCSELHERFEAFKRRSLYDINLVVLSSTRSTCRSAPAARRRA
jgi:transposase-like protein